MSLHHVRHPGWMMWYVVCTLQWHGGDLSDHVSVSFHNVRHPGWMMWYVVFCTVTWWRFVSLCVNVTSPCQPSSLDDVVCCVYSTVTCRDLADHVSMSLHHVRHLVWMMWYVLCTLQWHGGDLADPVSGPSDHCGHDHPDAGDATQESAVWREDQRWGNHQNSH